jgi:UDPglucose 6-dehydrogenase
LLHSGGYVGGPSSAVIAFKNPSIDVTVLDMDEERIRAWNSQSLPVYEHGLHDIVTAARDGYRRSWDTDVNRLTAAEHDNTPLIGGSMMTRHKAALEYDYRRPNLFFSTNIKEGIQHADVIFISVNTPTKLHGVGKGFASDLENFEAAARSIASYATDDKIIVEKSTVPCRTAETLREVVSCLDAAVSMVFFRLLTFLTASCQLQTRSAV